MYVFTKENHIKQFKFYVQQLIKSNIIFEERNHAINELMSAYIEQVDLRPPQYELELLANFILKEDLADRHPDKVTREQYPMLSERQQITRKNKEFIKDESVIDYIQLKKSSNQHNLNKRKTFNTE